MFNYNSSNQKFNSENNKPKLNLNTNKKSQSQPYYNSNSASVFSYSSNDINNNNNNYESSSSESQHTLKQINHHNHHHQPKSLSNDTQPLSLFDSNKQYDTKKLKRTHNHDKSQIDTLQHRFSSFDLGSYQIDKKIKLDDLDESTNTTLDKSIEQTTILRSLLREESSLMTSMKSNCQSVDSNLNKSKNDSDTSNLSFIINDDENLNNIKKTNNDSRSSELNGTFYINSDSEEEHLPNGWSINWTSDGRKYYIGKF